MCKTVSGCTDHQFAVPKHGKVPISLLSLSPPPPLQAHPLPTLCYGGTCHVGYARRSRSRSSIRTQVCARRPARSSWRLTRSSKHSGSNCPTRARICIQYPRKAFRVLWFFGFPVQIMSPLPTSNNILPAANVVPRTLAVIMAPTVMTEL